MASSFSSPWPDPKSPVLSKIDFGVPLVELFKWLDVRDTLLGENFKKQNIPAALALALDCKHPDAEWLTSIFEGKDISTGEHAREIFLSFQNDARALCFAWYLSVDRTSDQTLLRRSSEMGNALACSRLCEQVYGNEEEASRLAQFAAGQHERDGCFMVWSLFCGRDSEKDSQYVKENHLIAAELGHAWAAQNFGALLDESDPARWLWLGRAALRGLPAPFLLYFSNQVEKFLSGSGYASIVFLIGLALKGNIDTEKKEMFGSIWKFDFLFGTANQAVSFYDAQTQCARLAVDTWTLVSTRLHLIKDMRIYIGKLIWEARFEANYK